MTDQIKANWDEVVDEGTLPAMRANATLKNWSRATTSTDRLMFRLGWMIDEPKEYRGLFVNDNVIVGGMEDHNRMSFEPTQQDSRRLKSLLNALQVPLNEDVELCLRSAEQGKCTVYIAEPTKSDLAAGYDRNKVRNYYGLGSVEVGLIDGQARAPSAPAMPPPPTGASVPAMPPPGSVEPA